MEKESMLSSACRPMPMRELTSVTATAVMASAPTMGTISRLVPKPVPE